MKPLTLSTNQIPERLRQLPQIPERIYCLGTDLTTLLIKPTLGVVGSRNVSAYGRTITTDLTMAAARRGVVIVSGLALGVDSIAHQAALDARGTTIAVLPCGIETIYPRSHHGLGRQILDKGSLLVSEYAGKTMPMRHSFLERNRIIAGLSDALLVTEAAERSGSLHTARFALEQGKTVLAVPGNITSPTSAGTNNLIKMGATPITCAEDIFEALGIQAEDMSEELSYYAENEAEQAIISLLDKGPQDGSELYRLSKLPIDKFQQSLTMLEINGAIHPLGNNIWKLK